MNQVSDQDRTKAKDAIIKARVGLLIAQPFWGNLAMNLKIVEQQDLPTAATDGRCIYYSPDFVNELNDSDPQEALFLMAHEVSHVVNGHIDFRGVRNPLLWNIAGDYKINGDLVKFNIGKMPKKALYDAKYDGMNTFEIYDSLVDEIKELIKSKGQGAGDERTKELESGLLDDHIDMEDKTPEEKADMAEKILNAAQAAKASGAGNIPGNVAEFIKDLDTPKISWSDYIRSRLMSSKVSDYSFTRPSRKGWHCDAILPGHHEDSSVDVDIFIDMSGSVSSELAKSFVSEIAGMMDSFNNYKIRIATFDTKIQSMFEVSSEGGEDLTDYEYKGRGGTSFVCVYDYLKEKEIVPEHLIVFSDGGTFDGWGDEDYCETLWVLAETNVVPPHGSYIYMD